MSNDLQIDTNVPHSARRYDYLLGGTDNFLADRVSAQVLEEFLPGIRLSVQENRAFLRRAVDYMARAGIRQFLEIGSGLPTSPNVHEIAAAVDPTSQVVYGDNDPVVLMHGRAVLSSGTAPNAVYVDADLRRPEELLADPVLGRALDLSRPVGLAVIGVLQYLPEADQPHRCVARLVSALAPGSQVAIGHGTYDYHLENAAMADEAMKASGLTMYARSYAEVTRFFDGLDVVPPGVVPISEWRAETETQPRHDAGLVNGYGGVGIKRLER
jgi:O-methyltransferase involved in polyketide biosynthesis